MKNESIEAVTFDAAGTLIHLAESVGESYSRVAARHGIQARPEDLDRAFSAVWKRTPPPFSRESPIRDSNEKAWWRRIVFEVFTKAGAILPPPPEFSQFFEDLYRHFESPGTWALEPDAREAVSTIAQTYRCALLSNFDGRLRPILRDLDMLDFFEQQFLSCEIGASKPDPKIFSAAAHGLDLAPEHIIHVGDDPLFDWKGAEDAGFQIFRTGKQGRPLRELIDELSLA